MGARVPTLGNDPQATDADVLAAVQAWGRDTRILADTAGTEPAGDRTLGDGTVVAKGVKQRAADAQAAAAAATAAAASVPPSLPGDVASLQDALARALQRITDLEGEVYVPGTLAFVGDSLTFGLNVASPGKYPDQVAALPPYTRRNLGVSGDTYAFLFSRAAETDAALTLSARNVLVLWCGTNDIEAGRTPAQIASDRRSYCLARKAAGWDRIVLLTTINRNANDVNFYRKQAEVNTTLRNEYADYADAVADVAVARQTQTTTDTTYFNTGDSIHLNATGYGVVAGVVDRTIEAIDVPAPFDNFNVDFVRPAYGTTYLTARGEPTAIDEGAFRSAQFVLSRQSRFALQFASPPIPFGTTPGSIALWIRPDTLPGEALALTIPGLRVYTFGSQLAIYIGGGALYAPALQVGVWQSVVIGSTGTGQTWVQLADGGKVTDSLAAPAQSGASLGAIGSNNVGQLAEGSYFDGRIADVCFWNGHLLTDAEIAVYRSGGVPRSLAGFRSQVAGGAIVAPSDAWFFSPL